MDIGPKSRVLVRENIKELLRQFQANVASHINEKVDDSEIDEKLIDSIIEQIIRGNIRYFFDFHDVNKCILTIQEISNNHWEYTIDTLQSKNNYKSRKDVEVAGFQEAFNILEERLEQS